MPQDRFSPLEVAQAYRATNPGKFDEFDDAELVGALKHLDPQTYGMIDPLLEGAELLAPIGAGRPGMAAPPAKPTPLPTPAAQPTWTDTAVTTGLRLGGGLAGGLAGAPGGPLGIAAGGAVGSGLGDAAAQYYEQRVGTRKELSPTEMAISAGLGAVPLGSVAELPLAGRMAVRAGQGALLGPAGTLAEDLTTGERPTAGQLATSALTGGVVGGLMHGGVEAVEGAAAKAPSFGDSTGALPTAGGPPEMTPLKPSWFPGDHAAWKQEVDAIKADPTVLHDPAFHAAIDQQYQAEETRLAAALTEVYGPLAKPANSSDFHTALEAKQYLEQLAELRLSREQVGVLMEAANNTLEPMAPPEAAPPPLALPPGEMETGRTEFGPPIPSYPNDAVLDLTDPNARVVGGAPPSAPPNTPRGQAFQQTMEESLQAPPGPPRLVRPLVLSSPEGSSGIPRGMDQLPLRGGPPSMAAPLAGSGTMGGKRATRAQPRLQGVGEEPRPVGRTYPEGPNTGPRRPAHQELHQAPRLLANPTKGGKATPSTLPAEDPGTYPAEVRRELASMLYELQEHPHEQVGGGLTRGQIDAARDQNPHMDSQELFAELKRSGASSGGAIPGAPVYHEILGAAEGFQHATREQVIQKLRAAVLEGKGSHLSDAAAQVARARLAGEGAEPPLHGHAAGDHLIGWEDAAGRAAIPDHDLSEWQRVAREATDGDILGLHKSIQRHGIDPGMEEAMEAMLDEGVRRGLITPEQGDLRMEGPGGAGGPKLTDFAGGPPPERLPGMQQDDVRAQPEVAEAPFALTPPPSKPPKIGDLQRMQMGLWDRLKNEEGVVILQPPPPSGDRAGLKRWLKAQEEEHGGAHWFSRVEHFLAEENFDRAWQAAAAASAKSYTQAYAKATPQEEAQLRQLVKGTALQDDLQTQLVAQGRRGQVARPAPTVKDFPPSQRIGRDVKGVEIGPAGILNLGEPQEKVARGSQAQLLDRDIMDSFVDAAEDHPELLHLIRGNRDAALRVGRQIADLIAQGQIPFDYDNFPGMTRYEAGRQYRNTLSEAGRVLAKHSNFVQQFDGELHEMADAMSFGGALAGSIKGSTTGGAPPIKGARGRALTSDASVALEKVATDLNLTAGDQAALLNDLREKHPQSLGQALVNSQYAFLTSGLPTAIRNAISFGQRYTVEVMDDLITAGVGKALGGTVERAAGREAGARARERTTAIATGRKGITPAPLRGLSETFEDIYGLTPSILKEGARPNDVKQTLRVLASYPAEAAHLIGAVQGETEGVAQSKSSILNAIGSPKVQRWLQIWNRAQEFPTRALAFDTNFRAQLRAQGMNPSQVLANPDLGAMAEAVGGKDVLGRMLFKASADAREMTYAGGFAKNSVPGWMVHMIQEAWPAKLAVRFPAFNFARAPRWIYDHGPWALADLVRLPFDRAGQTSTGKYLGGGRLFRGLQAAQYETDVIPALRGQIHEAEGQVGDALQQLQSTSTEWGIRQRQVSRLEARQQAGLPDLPTAYGEAVQRRDDLAAKRGRLQATLKDANRTVGDLQKQEDVLWKKVQNATGIHAPTYSAWMGRMAAGTISMLGAAVVMRSSKYAEGTKYDQLRIPREGQDSWNMDFSAFAPVPQFMFIADVMVDFERHTDWKKVREEMGEAFSPGETAAAVGSGAALGGAAAGPLGAASGAILGGSSEQALKWNRAIWNAYEGKYTPDALGADFGRAFLSMSRMAGTALTITDLMTRNGWPGLQDVADAAVGTIGQFLAGYATPLGQVKDLLGAVSPDEATIRNVPKSDVQYPQSWSYPLTQPLTRIPGADRLLPPAVSQTSGKVIRGEHPAMRTLTGVGGTPSDFVQEEARRVGVPGSSLYIRETGDVGLDRMVAESYGRLLKEELPAVLEDPEYVALGTPARQRDFLQRHILPTLKRAALAEAREGVGEESFQAATVKGEAARKKTRQLALIAELEAREGSGGGGDAGDSVGGPPPSPPSLAAPPPPMPRPAAPR